MLQTVLQIIHLESSGMGKKNSNLGDTNLESYLLSNILDKGNRKSEFYIRKLYAKYN